MNTSFVVYSFFSDLYMLVLTLFSLQYTSLNRTQFSMQNISCVSDNLTQLSFYSIYEETSRKGRDTDWGIRGSILDLCIIAYENAYEKILLSVKYSIYHAKSKSKYREDKTQLGTHT